MSSPKSRRSREETRQFLLETGRQVMLEEGLPEGTNIKLTSVLERAGLTTGAAYQLWKSQQLFQEELALFVAKEFEWARPNTDPDKLRALAVGRPDLTEGTRRVAVFYWDAFVSRPEFLMILHFWGVRTPRPELSDAIREGYDIVHNGLLEMFDRTLEFYGLKFREPYTGNDMAVAMTAATEGLVLRQHMDPERVRHPNDELHGGEQIYIGLLQAIIDHFTVALDD